MNRYVMYVRTVFSRVRSKCGRAIMDLHVKSLTDNSPTRGHWGLSGNGFILMTTQLPGGINTSPRVEALSQSAWVSQRRKWLRVSVGSQPRTPDRCPRRSAQIANLEGERGEKL